MAVIRTNVPNFTGYRASVYFRNGVGSTDTPHLIEWFKAHGYIVESEAEPKIVESQPTVTKAKTRIKANNK